MKNTKENYKDLDSVMNSGDVTNSGNNGETTEKILISKNPKNNKDINDKKKGKLLLFETFLLRYSDPINSISLSDNYLLFGSMIGKVILFNIPKKQYYHIYNLASENIMGTSVENEIDNKIVHFVSVGDETAVSLIEKINEEDVESHIISNYTNKDMHQKMCPESFTLLWKNKALLINLSPAKNHDDEVVVEKREVNFITYGIEGKINDLCFMRQIEMSNYTVPFDFKDDIFLFLEYIGNDRRSICLYEFDAEKETQKKVLTTVLKEFGHISFIKIIEKNLILVVRNYSLIEIYDIEDGFKLLASHNNNIEINSIDYCELKNENIVNTNNDKVYNIILIDEEQNIVELKFEKGSQFLEVLFIINVNDIEGISNELKLRGLFNFDFPYYIKNSKNYMALTTDLACFLFKK